MKAFRPALITLILLVALSISLSLAGDAKVEKYLRRLPDAESPAEGEAILADMAEDFQKDRLFFNAVFPHGRVDELQSAIRRAMGAAAARDEAEYRILLFELENDLRAMQRDLTLHLDDML